MLGSNWILGKPGIKANTTPPTVNKIGKGNCQRRAAIARKATASKQIKMSSVLPMRAGSYFSYRVATFGSERVPNSSIPTSSIGVGLKDSKTGISRRDLTTGRLSGQLDYDSVAQREGATLSLSNRLSGSWSQTHIANSVRN